MVWPGVWTATHSRPPTSRTWASSTRLVGDGVLDEATGRLAHGPVPQSPRPGHRVGIAAPRRLLGQGTRFHRLAANGVDLGLHRCRRGLEFIGRFLVLGRRVEEGPERAVGDDLGAELSLERAGLPEVVGVAVGHDHRVHPLDRIAGRSQRLVEGLPRPGAWQTGIDERDAPCVLHGVAIHVAEAGHRDRELHPHDAGHDLLHAFAWWPPFLPDRLRGIGRMVGHTATS